MISIGVMAVVTIGALAWHCAVLWRMCPSRRDLLENSHGYERFKDFLSQSWMDNSRARNYTEEGQRLMPLYRTSALVSLLAILGLWIALALHL
jgi:hypothetical protein